MFDLAQLTLSAADGGNGKVSFYRAKFISKGGPDGGKGGNGGSVYLQGDRGLHTLQHLAGVKGYEAKRGQDGGKKDQIGHKGEDITIKVPLGTIVWLLGENQASAAHRQFVPREGQLAQPLESMKYDLGKPSGAPPPRPSDNIEPIEKTKLFEITDDKPILICQGGLGGRSNVAFKGPARTTPFIAEYGTFGEKKEVQLELRLLADVGLVGYPNAGKSTLLSVLTKARPKVGAYPFTTLEPNLGVMQLQDKADIVIADIPGLIEGASQGKGLGHDFLRHIKACQLLVGLVTLEESTIFNQNITDQEKAEQLWNEWQILAKELETYDASLMKKPRMLCLSKIDIMSDTLRLAIHEYFKKHKVELFDISAATGDGVAELGQRLEKHFADRLRIE